MVYVKSFRDLEVYKLAREVSKEVFILSKGFPKEEKFSLVDQMRRSSRSIGAQIAAIHQQTLKTNIPITDYRSPITSPP